MDLASIQQQLPSGLRIDAVLKQDVVFGDVYRLFDSRVAPNAPVERRLRVFEVRATDEWRESVIKCVQGFCQLRSSQFATPQEFGTLNCGAISLIEDVFPTNVDEQLPAKGYQPDTAWPWVEQALAGLAELHAVGLPHGAWQLSSLQFTTQAVAASTRLVLGDAIGGRVPWLSKGQRLTNGLSEYFPPEWNGRLQAPSPQADIYAMGLVACEMMLGRETVKTVKQQHGQSAAAPERIRKQLLNKAVNKGLSRHGRKLLARMLEPNPQLRPAHARAALETPSSILRPVNVLALASGVLVIATILLSIGWSRQVGQLQSAIADFRKQLDNEHQETDKAKANTDKVQEELDSKKSELEKKNEGIREIDGQLTAANKRADAAEAELQRIKGGSGKQSLSSLERAKRRWGSLSEKVLHTQSTSLPTAVEKVSCETDERPHLKLWAENVKQAWNGIEPTLTAEQRKSAALTRRTRALVAFKREPWREDLRDAVVQAYWTDFLPVPSKPQLSRIDRVISEIEKSPTDTWLRKSLNVFAKQIGIERDSYWRRWLDSEQPAKVLAPFHERLEHPWDNAAKVRAAEHLKSLQSAERVWRKFAYEPKDSWKDFSDKVSRAADVEGVPVRQIVNAWITEFEATSKWKIVLQSGTAPTGFGTTRIVRLVVEDKTTIELSDREWSVETFANYADGKTPSKEVEWRPGQQIKFALDGERSWTSVGIRPEIYSQTFSGPVALWWAAQNKIAEDKKKGASIKFSFPKCPGPPPQ